MREVSVFVLLLAACLGTCYGLGLTESFKYALSLNPRPGNGPQGRDLTDAIPMVFRGREYDCAVPKPQKIVDAEADNVTLDVAEMMNKISTSLDRKCFYLTQGWWTYRYCFNETFEQYRQKTKDPWYSLGSDAGTPSLVYTKDNPKETYLKLPYFNGTTCDITGENRTSIVRAYCPEAHGRVNKPMISDEAESSTCKYTLDFFVPALCDYPGFKPKGNKNVRYVQCKPNESSSSSPNNKNATFLTGSWDIFEGYTVNGGRGYGGQIHVEPFVDDSYIVQWVTQAGNYSGLAYYEDGHLLTGWGTLTRFIVILLEIMDDGSLVGRWSSSQTLGIGHSYTAWPSTEEGALLKGNDLKANGGLQKLYNVERENAAVLSSDTNDLNGRAHEFGYIGLERIGTNDDKTPLYKFAALHASSPDVLNGEVEIPPLSPTAGSTELLEGVAMKVGRWLVLSDVGLCIYDFGDLQSGKVKDKVRGYWAVTHNRQVGLEDLRPRKSKL